jgi:hypothetical protein
MFGLSRCLFLPLFLISGFPAVDNLGQNFANAFDVRGSPHVKPNLADLDQFWRWYLLGGDIATQRRDIQAKSPCGLTSGKRFHRIVVWHTEAANVNGVEIRSVSAGKVPDRVQESTACMNFPNNANGRELKARGKMKTALKQDFMGASRVMEWAW